MKGVKGWECGESSRPKEVVYDAKAQGQENISLKPLQEFE